MGATVLCLLKAFVQMLSMYKAKPEFVFGFSLIFKFYIRMPQLFSMTYKDGQLTWDSWGWELCRSWHSTHFWQTKKKLLSVLQNTFFCTWGAFTWRTSMNNDTHSWKGGRGTAAPWTMSDSEVNSSSSLLWSFFYHQCLRYSLLILILFLLIFFLFFLYKFTFCVKKKRVVKSWCHSILSNVDIVLF